MPKIDERIRDIDKTICQNIDLIDFETVSRALVSQNLLSQSRNLVEHVAVKAYADAKGEDLEADWETIPAATEYIKHHNKFQFLRKFHNFLQESKSHYTPDGEGAERLVLKYYDIKMSPSHSEYIGMMQYLSNSGASLLDIVTAPRDIYNLIKQKMFGKSQVHYFENVLDKCRRLIRTKGAGSTTVRYLLHTLNNKVIKNQLGSGSCWKLSDLYLDWGCIPFDQMPFATSLRQHNPESAELFGSLSADNRKHEFVARYMLSNMSTKSIVKFRVTRKKDSDDDKEFADDTDIPFQIAYAVSIHKAQGLEYDSVKVIITEEVDEMITHNIFYTAITRSKKHLKIYWSPETQEKVIGGFELADAKRDASIFKAQTGMRMYKVR